MTNPRQTPIPRRALAAATAAALLALGAAGASAQDLASRDRVPLRPPAAGDLSATTLAARGETPPMAVPEVPREPVSFTYPLDPDQPLDTRPVPYRATSRQYWQQVDAGDLERGVPLYTTAAGALVRLSPVAADGPTAIDPSALVLTTPAGEELLAGDGMSLLADAEALRATGVVFPEGSAAFRIDPALGAGRFELRAPELAARPGRYLVHVVDTGSELTLAMGAGDTAILAGGELTVDAVLADRGGPVAADELEGFVSSPDGRLWPVEFAPDGRGAWRASVSIDGAAAGAGLWEIHLRAAGEVGGLTAVRSVRVPFAVAAPVARLTGDAVVVPPPARGGALRVELPVEVSAPGRYEVRGVIWGTAADGALKPAVAVHAAEWIEPGGGTLALEAPADQLAAAGLGAPWELRDLRLLDQGRLGLLHRQAVALTIP